MQDVRFQWQIPGEIYCTFGKENEAFGIVTVVPAVLIVDSSPVKISGVIHEVSCQARADIKGQQSGTDSFCSQWQIEFPIDPSQPSEALLDAAVKRGDNRD